MQSGPRDGARTRRTHYYVFGVGRGSVTDRDAVRIKRIAAEHDCTFSRIKDLDGWKYFFAGPYAEGDLNAKMASDVLTAIAEAGVTLP